MEISVFLDPEYISSNWRARLLTVNIQEKGQITTVNAMHTEFLMNYGCSRKDIFHQRMRHSQRQAGIF
jgi:hypothetical protein